MTTTKHWHVSRNIVGYLPETEEGNYSFSDWSSARDSLANDISNWADQFEYDSDGVGISELARSYDQAIAEVRSAEDEMGLDIFLPSFDGDHALDVHFWLVECAETDCETEDDQ